MTFRMETILYVYKKGMQLDGIFQAVATITEIEEEIESRIQTINQGKINDPFVLTANAVQTAGILYDELRKQSYRYNQYPQEVLEVVYPTDRFHAFFHAKSATMFAKAYNTVKLHYGIKEDDNNLNYLIEQANISRMKAKESNKKVTISDLREAFTQCNSTSDRLDFVADILQELGKDYPELQAFALSEVEQTSEHELEQSAASAPSSPLPDPPSALKAPQSLQRSSASQAGSIVFTAASEKLAESYVVVIPKDRLNASVTAFVSRLPDVVKSIIEFAVTVVRVRPFEGDALTFNLEKISENDGLPGYYVRVFDESEKEVYFERQNKNTDPLRTKNVKPLETPEEKLARAKRDFIEAFNASLDSGKVAVLHNLLKQIGHDDLLPLEAFTAAAQPSANGQPQVEPVPPLPDSPTKFWLKDRQPDETPPDFVVRVYGDWLGGKGLTRAYLQKDAPLYTALRKYLKKAKDEGIPLPEGFDLPSLQEASASRRERQGVTSAAETWQRLMEAASPEVKDLLLTYHSLRRSPMVHP